jgi:hypothetical protein
MRRRSRQLAAVTGPARIEYFVPASIADALGGKGNYAFCYPDAERVLAKLVAHADYSKAKAARATDEARRIENLRNYGYDEKTIAAEAKKRAAKAKRESKAGSAFTDFVTGIQKDVARLRRNGVTGSIPLCVNRTSGKRGAKRPAALRRATATHERFHADARRVEVDAGLTKPFECWESLDASLGEAYTPALRRYSFLRYADGKPRLAAEELLARVEEVRKACWVGKRKAKDCDPLISDIVKHMDMATAQDFVKLATSVKTVYGTPLNAVRAAVRACSLSTKKTGRLGRLSNGQKLLLATALPIIPPL